MDGIFSMDVDVPVLPVPPQTFFGMASQSLEEWPKMQLHIYDITVMKCGGKAHEIQDAGAVDLVFAS
jgi:hypothetical protein